MNRIEHTLFADTAAIRTDLKARDLAFDVCAKSHAVELTRQWHSRLPNVQAGPWMYAFKAFYDGVTYAVALWNSPSARTLPSHWLELRRLACAPGVPRNTCSRFLSWMIKYFKRQCPERERCISYQDTEVHAGTIYKASNWQIAYVGKKRYRDRSKNRAKTTRAYRSNINTADVDAAAKVRWEYPLTSPVKADTVGS